ncbi:hypothetical protein MTO96_043295, partial [Rhipicephalus appendiculatus]
VVVDDTGRTCVYGIVQQCLKNEECVTSGPRRRTGTCRCRQGFTKDPVSGSCTGPQNASLSSQAGGDGNKFQYQWTLVSHPDGEETGVMQDQNTQALKLSHLREGLYTFRVAVTGNNSYGEATTNRKRINKPPVAIIQPDNVTVKLPSKDTVLDGSFSTDDDKIVQYHWEPITIPIGYSPKLNDTPTVQLKDLIPGFYQFMLKVTDSDGVTNTTSANVTVLKEMDYPPTAKCWTPVCCLHAQ